MLTNDIARANIKKYRKMRRMSQKEFAEALNVTHSSVSAWEIGKNSIDLNRLQQICEVLNTTLEDIIFETNTIVKAEEPNEIIELANLLERRPEIREFIRISEGSSYKDIVMVTSLLRDLKHR